MVSTKLRAWWYIPLITFTFTTNSLSSWTQGKIIMIMKEAILKQMYACTFWDRNVMFFFRKWNTYHSFIQGKNLISIVKYNFFAQKSHLPLEKKNEMTIQFPGSLMAAPKGVLTVMYLETISVQEFKKPRARMTIAVLPFTPGACLLVLLKA